MKRSADDDSLNPRVPTELESVIQALNTYAKSINFNTKNGESKSARGLRTFCTEVSSLQIRDNERDAIWEFIFSLSNFQAKARNKLKIKRTEERDKSLRSWGAFAILTVALFLVVVMFLFGLLTSSSWMVLACFGCSSVALAVVALFFYGEYGKACDLLRSVIDKVDLIKDVDVKIEQLNETLSRPS